MERRAIWASRYAIFDEIARGNMATIYIGARLGQVNNRRVVAVKKLAEDFAKEPEFVAMFLDEARLAARVRHPNVIETFQVLRVPGSLAIVMELVVGTSLLELLRTTRERGMDVPPGVTGAIVSGALRGLHAAHEAKDETGNPFNLVHRDVSPHNILIGKEGVPRVIDFGVAKAAGRLQQTEAGMTRGNYSYMSPEQIRGKGVDRRTDVYAAGVVLWEIYGGRHLFPVSSDTGLLGRRAAGVVRASAPSTVNPRVPATVDALIMRALDFDASQRFTSAAEMADAVEKTFGVDPPAAVAEWVVDLAQQKIRELGVKVREVEEAFDRGELEPAARTSQPDVKHGWEAPLVIDAPNLDLAPATERTPPPRISSASNLRAVSAPPRKISSSGMRAVSAGGPPKPAPLPLRPISITPAPTKKSRSSGTVSLIVWSLLAVVLLVAGIKLVVTMVLPILKH